MSPFFCEMNSFWLRRALCKVVFALGAVLAFAGIFTFASHWGAARTQSPMETAKGIPIRAVPLSFPFAKPRSSAPLRVVLALDRLTPRDFSRFAELLHGVRLWGTERHVPRGDWPGDRMLQVILDGKRAAEQFGSVIQVINRHGVTFSVWDPRVRGQGEPHRDKTLAVLGGLGVESARPLVVAQQSRMVKDVVRASLANFSWDQELAFSAMAFAYYLPPQTAWLNKYDQPIDLNGICERLCLEPLGTGTCYGHHNLSALAILLAADKHHPILTVETKNVAIARLSESARLLETTQAGSGSWDENWFAVHGHSQRQTHATEDARTPDPASEVIATSHALEWLILAPDVVSLPDEKLDQALMFLVENILHAVPAQLEQYQMAYSHAGAALKAWYPTAWKELALQHRKDGEG